MRRQHAGRIAFFLLGSWWLILAGPAGAAAVVDFGSRPARRKPSGARAIEPSDETIPVANRR